MSDILVVLGNDKLGRRAGALLAAHHGLSVALDKSTSFTRLAKILWRGSLSPTLLAKMALADWSRPDYPVPAHAKPVFSEADLRALVSSEKIKKVFLFRAGLLVRQKTLDCGAEFFNIHCASLPAYPGLGAIARALADGSYSQNATLFRITSRIDHGDIVACEPYALDPRLSYAKNEDSAYQAGMRLLQKTIEGELGTAS